MKMIGHASSALAISIVATFTPSAAQDAHQHGHGACSCRVSPEATAFLAENDEAMTRMMAEMHMPPTGDVDRGFVTMMIPHHQSAIDMARAVLRSSRNEAVPRLAQEIIVTQEGEIRAMRLALGDHAIPSTSMKSSAEKREDR